MKTVYHYLPHLYCLRIRLGHFLGMFHVWQLRIKLLNFLQWESVVCVFMILPC